MVTFRLPAPVPMALLGLSLSLAACVSPQQRCLGDVTRDLRVVDRLIVQTQATLARGYALRQDTTYVPSFDFCGPRGYYRDRRGRIVAGPPELCETARPVTRRSAVAVDLRAEQSKLDSLRAKRAQLAANANAAVAQCRAAYPA